MDSKTKTDISIIIVNYNSGYFLYRCLTSIKDKLTIAYEVIVVDNNSTDDSVRRCFDFESKQIRFIHNNENLGFSRANNIGADYSHGRILHFLNPDTQINSDMNDDYLKILKDQEQGKDTVYVNPMKNRDGSIDTGCCCMLTPLNYVKSLFTKTRCSFFYIGATVILSQNLFEKIGRWNELFYMYVEDMELFYRINKLKIPIIEMKSIVEHYGGASSEKVWSSFERELMIQRSFRLFYKLYYSLPEYWLMQFFILFAFIRRPKRAWWQVKVIAACFKSDIEAKK